MGFKFVIAFKVYMFADAIAWLKDFCVIFDGFLGFFLIELQICDNMNGNQIRTWWGGRITIGNKWVSLFYHLEGYVPLQEQPDLLTVYTPSSPSFLKEKDHRQCWKNANPCKSILCLWKSKGCGPNYGYTNLIVYSMNCRSYHKTKVKLQRKK